MLHRIQTSCSHSDSFNFETALGLLSLIEVWRCLSCSLISAEKLACAKYRLLQCMDCSVAHELAHPYGFVPRDGHCQVNCMSGPESLRHVAAPLHSAHLASINVSRLNKLKTFQPP